MRIHSLKTTNNFLYSRSVSVINKDTIPTIFKGPFANQDQLSVQYKTSPEQPVRPQTQESNQSLFSSWYSSLKNTFKSIFASQPASAQPIKEEQTRPQNPSPEVKIQPQHHVPAVNPQVADVIQPKPFVKPQPEVVDYKPQIVPSELQKGPYPRYDKIFEDGLMDVTIAIGFDEPGRYYNGANISQERKLDSQLRARGYVKSEVWAKKLLKEAGRTADQQYAAFYVRENVAQNNGEPVHSVIRVIKSAQGQNGAQNKAAALQGMNQSDVFMYGGHARYGSGPDFNQNFKVTINWDGIPDAPARGTVVYDDYNTLKKLLAPDNNNATAIAKFKALQKQNKVTIEGVNDGNIVLNKSPKHQNEFGGYLMYEAVKNAPLELKDSLKQDSYRLWLLNGCRTKDYTAGIRAQAKANPNLNSENLDLFLTRESLQWNDISDSLMGFLDGVLAQNNTVQIIHRLNEANPSFSQRTHGRQGFDDNPWRNPVKN